MANKPCKSYTGRMICRDGFPERSSCMDGVGATPHCLNPDFFTDHLHSPDGRMLLAKSQENENGMA